MTWDIVAGLIILLGAAISVCTIVANNTRAVTELKCAVEALQRSMCSTDKSMDKLAEKVEDHEHRIIKLEDRM